MSHLEHHYTRPNGSEVKIVARAFYGAGLHLSIGVDVFHRATSAQNWNLANDRPHPNWREMPLDDYNKFGRAEKFQVASHGEILKAAQRLRDQLAVH